MAAFDNNAPANLFPARRKDGRCPVGIRRFGTAAGAILDGVGIRVLYESVDYPLVKTAR
jgi:hypothetical protein